MTKITLPTIMSKLLEISENSYFRWKKKDHVSLICLLEKYHTKEEIKEFLETGKISKMERIDELLEIEKKYTELVNLFKKLDS
jgi:hypothetical protein